MKIIITTTMTMMMIGIRYIFRHDTLYLYILIIFNRHRPFHIPNHICIGMAQSKQRSSVRRAKKARIAPGRRHSCIRGILLKDDICEL